MADEFNGASTSKLVANLLSEFQQMASVTGTVGNNLNTWKTTLKSIMGGGPGGQSPGTMIANSSGTFSGGFSFGSAAAGLASATGNLAMGLAGAAATAMPSVQTAVTSQLLTSQAKFSGMQGNVNGTVRSLMGMGTTNSATDVQEAIALGTSRGVLPGLTGYNSQIMPGVMQLSNLTGSATSAMQATTALNSGQSVNTLRMMGINVRGSSGSMRNPAAIFRDIYNFAVSQSGGRLNKSNISIALQPGNGLANLLDAASAGDPTLRDALQKAALQFSQGGDLSLASTTSTGQTTTALNSQSKLNQSSFGLVAASQKPEATGFTEANKLLSSATNHLANLVSSNQAAAWALTQLAKGETGLSNPIGKGAAGGLASVFGFLKKTAPIIGAVIGSAAGPEGTIAGAALGSAIGGLGQGAGSGLGQGATVSPQTSSIQSTASANLVLQTGVSLTGIPYSWGGGSIGGPTRGTNQGSGTVGFDCSSFVQYVYARVGVMLPRTTYAQINYGIAVEPTQAQPGDLLFFGNPQAPHHVAIYMGNNRLIQAPQTGQTIGTASVNLAGVSACRRVVSGATGTAPNSNLLKGGHRSVTTMSGSLSAVIASMSSNNVSGGLGNSISMNDLVGYSPSAAMSGGTVSGSGIGQGDTSNGGASQVAMAQQYLSISSKTGTLEASTTSPSSGQALIINGGVTIPIHVPNGTKLDETKLSKLIADEVKNLGISVRMATK